LRGGGREKGALRLISRRKNQKSDKRFFNFFGPMGWRLGGGERGAPILTEAVRKGGQRISRRAQSQGERDREVLIMGGVAEKPRTPKEKEGGGGW